MNRARKALPEGGAQQFAAVRPAATPARQESANGSLVHTPRVAGAMGLAYSASLDPSSRPVAPQPFRAEQRLVQRVCERCQAAIQTACRTSSVPPEFLGALTANESGGNPNAARFEPAVYRHLAAVAAGEARAYGSITADALTKKLGRVVHSKAEDFHAQFLTPPFGANHRDEIARLPDESLRELATSWGYTQIMGYHVVGRRGTVRDLLQPEFHFHVALELLAEFAAVHQLDLRGEFAEMFACWNTGQPYGKCYDPHYIDNGLARMTEYKKCEL